MTFQQARRYVAILLVVVYFGRDVFGYEDLAHLKNDTTDQEGDKASRYQMPNVIARTRHLPADPLALM